jgi:hypothetical protein
MLGADGEYRKGHEGQNHRPTARTIFGPVGGCSGGDMGFCSLASQTDIRVSAERNTLLLAAPRESEIPVLGAFGADNERQAVRVAECVVLILGPGPPDIGT